jgi:hypothetical protein
MDTLKESFTWKYNEQFYYKMKHTIIIRNSYAI